MYDVKSGEAAIRSVENVQWCGKNEGKSGSENFCINFRVWNGLGIDFIAC